MGKALKVTRGAGANPAEFAVTKYDLAVGLDYGASKTYSYDQSKKYLVTVLVWNKYSSSSKVSCHQYALAGGALIKKAALEGGITSNEVTATAVNGTLTVSVGSPQGGADYRYCGALFSEIK